MIALKNKPNVIQPTSIYPHGMLKDDTGVGDGTPITQQTNNDIHSFLQQLMVDAELTPNNILDNEYNGFQLNTALGLFINKMILAGSVTRRVVISIGDWNMDTTQFISVVHGLTLSKIRSVNVMIIKDDSSLLFPLSSPNVALDGTVDGGVLDVNPLSVDLYRRTTGQFDGANFDSTSFNRGFVTIDYIQ